MNRLRALATVAAFACGVCATPSVVLAKARLIAIFPLRSTPETAARAQKITLDVAAHFGAMDGFDAKVLAVPTNGSPGVAAAAAGAETYILGQVVATSDGVDIKLGSFATATDKSIAEWSASVHGSDPLPEKPALSNLLALSASTTSVANGNDASTPPGSVAVSSGLPIVMTLDAPLSSASAKVGDKFTLRSIGNVVSEGKIIVEKGAQGEGEIASVETAGGNGHPGKMSIQYNWITAIDGSKIKLSSTQTSSDGEAKSGAASTATVATYLLLGPLGLFAHNFVKGRDLTIDTTKKLTAYVEHTVHVTSNLAADGPQNGGFAH